MRTFWEGFKLLLYACFLTLIIICAQLGSRYVVQHGTRLQIAAMVIASGVALIVLVSYFIGMILES